MKLGANSAHFNIQDLPPWGQAANFMLRQANQNLMESKEKLHAYQQM